MSTAHEECMCEFPKPFYEGRYTCWCRLQWEAVVDAPMTLAAALEDLVNNWLAIGSRARLGRVSETYVDVIADVRDLLARFAPAEAVSTDVDTSTASVRDEPQPLNVASWRPVAVRASL